MRYNKSETRIINNAKDTMKASSLHLYISTAWLMLMRQSSIPVTISCF